MGESRKRWAGDGDGEEKQQKKKKTSRRHRLGGREIRYKRKSKIEKRMERRGK